MYPLEEDRRDEADLLLDPHVDHPAGKARALPLQQDGDVSPVEAQLLFVRRLVGEAGEVSLDGGALPLEFLQQVWEKKNQRKVSFS